MNILTVDLEDWFHILDNPATNGAAEWARFEPRLPQQTENLLDCFRKHDTKATFFVLGWVAENFPETVAKIYSEGHEIACHSHMHQLVYRQNPKEFRADLEKATGSIELATGVRPRAYRAPGFSITAETAWAFDVLVDMGYDTDCSVFPASHAHGGFTNYGDGYPKRIRTPGGAQLHELPMNFVSVAGKKLVYGGGGYFRAMPGAIGRRFFRSADYNMTYFHPRDFDRGQPSIPGLSMGRRLRSNLGIRTALRKLERLLTDFDFVTVSAAKVSIDWSDTEEFVP